MKKQARETPRDPESGSVGWVRAHSQQLKNINKGGGQVGQRDLEQDNSHQLVPIRTVKKHLDQFLLPNDLFNSTVGVALPRGKNRVG